MDARPTDQPEHDNNPSPRHGRRLVTALLVAGALAAVPAGVALAGSSEGTAGGDGTSSGTGAVPAQSTTPEDGQQGRGDGHRGDCPEKDGPGGQEDSQGSTQL
jgi:hypothetical protein